MRCSLDISDFTEEMSSVSYSVVFLYFFELITEEGFLISPFGSFIWMLKWVYLSFSPLLFISLLFSAIHKASSDNHFAFLRFFFLGMVLITACCTMLRTSVHSSSGTLSDLIPWIYLSLTLYNCKGFDSGYLNGLVVFPTFFNLSLNLAINSSWSEPLSAPGLVFADCIELLHLWLQII